MANPNISKKQRRYKMNKEQTFQIIYKIGSRQLSGSITTTIDEDTLNNFVLNYNVEIKGRQKPKYCGGK
jgi:hypothetical protein